MTKKKVDYIIVGLGLAGIFTAFFLYQKKRTFTVIDNFNEHAATINSSGIINPVTGRKFQEAWNTDVFTTFAIDAYSKIEQLLGERFFYKKPIYKYFANQESEKYYDDKIDHISRYTRKLPKEDLLVDFLRSVHGAVKIEPAYTLHSKPFIVAFKNWLFKNNNIEESTFNYNDVNFTNYGIEYQGTVASGIIFCEGYKSIQNPWFNYLPIVPNKGEYLLVRIPNLRKQNIIHQAQFIIPLYDDVFWVGSNYEIGFDTEKPSEALKHFFIKQLENMFQIDFEIIGHFSGVRPTVLDRKPLVGIHPNKKQLAILNGFGTKGVSLAPYFAQQLVNHLLFHEPIMQEASLNRF